jgi:hypothetical protein
MNHIGIFEDLNYMSSKDVADELKRELKRWKTLQDDYLKWNVYKPTKLEFMDYIIRGMKSFLKSPF